MKSEDFCNWLKGYLELANPAEIRAREIEVIREHLELVAKKKQISKNFIEEGEKSFQKNDEGNERTTGSERTSTNILLI